MPRRASSSRAFGTRTQAVECRDALSAARDGAAEGFGLGGLDGAALKQRVQGVLQVGRGDLGGDSSVVAKLAVVIKHEHLRCAARAQKLRDAALRILRDRERVAVLERVRLRLLRRLDSPGIDAQEEDSL